VDECVWLAIITLDEAEALHGVEELDGACRGFAGQRALNTGGATVWTVAEATTILTGRRRTVFNRKRIAIDYEIRCGNLSTTIHERVAKRLAFGETGKAGLLDRADVDEHVLTTTILNDEAEALLSVEELDDAFAFANDLCRHLRTRAAAETAATATAAEAITAATETVAAATAAAEAITAAAEAIATATAEAVTAAAAEAAVKTTTAVAKAVTLVVATPAALTAPTSIKTHPSNYFLRNRFRPEILNLIAGRLRHRFGVIDTTPFPNITQNAKFR
jgi:uncharacterized protein YerC